MREISMKPLPPFVTARDENGRQVFFWGDNYDLVLDRISGLGIGFLDPLGVETFWAIKKVNGQSPILAHGSMHLLDRVERMQGVIPEDPEILEWIYGEKPLDT